jgi:synaptobrevin family protein YKT6
VVVVLQAKYIAKNRRRTGAFPKSFSTIPQSMLYYIGVWSLAAPGAAFLLDAAYNFDDVRVFCAPTHFRFFFKKLAYISWFGFGQVTMFQRSIFREALTFTARTLCCRVPVGLTWADYNGRNCFSLRQDDGLCAVVISAPEYPTRVAKTLAQFLCEKYGAGVSMHVAVKEDLPRGMGFPGGLATVLEEYKTPEKVDTICRLHSELSETKEVVAKSIELLMSRGERLEDLVAKSEDLSRTTKMFYTKAKVCDSLSQSSLGVPPHPTIIHAYSPILFFQLLPPPLPFSPCRV